MLVCDVFSAEPNPRIETRVIVVAADGRVWRGDVCEVSLDWPDGQFVID